MIDLRDIASWASDESSTDFINNLVNQLPQDDNAPISSSEFVLAFARCLAYAEGDEVAEVLERRASEYRRIGKLLGMERVNLHFNWSKFFWTLLADVCAPVVFPLSKMLDQLQIPIERRPDGEWVMLSKKLIDAQWLPDNHLSFDAFHWYLMKLWAPSLFSLVVMFVYWKDMDSLSPLEMSSSLTQFIIIAAYIATISGYEHSKHVVRRLHPARDVAKAAGAPKRNNNELKAVFAFRAHTPEGHAVDQIAAIADMLFSRHFHRLSTLAAVVAGIVHALTPAVHRMLIHAPESPTRNACMEPEELQWASQLYVWGFGGRGWVHLFVSLPAAAVSGYMTFYVLQLALNGFRYDLNFYYKLLLFRAATHAEPFLRYRGRWKQAEAKGNVTGRKEFLQFLNLQKHDDLLLWCRIRHLLVESYASFNSKQVDIIITFLMSWVILHTFYIFFGSANSQLSVFDLRIRCEVILYSVLLFAIVNLKVSIHNLRKSDISLLHKEYYFSCMADSDNEHTATKKLRGSFTTGGSRSVASRQSFSSWGSRASSHQGNENIADMPPQALAEPTWVETGIVGEHGWVGEHWQWDEREWDPLEEGSHEAGSADEHDASSTPRLRGWGSQSQSGTLDEDGRSQQSEDRFDGAANERGQDDADPYTHFDEAKEASPGSRKPRQGESWQRSASHQDPDTNVQDEEHKVIMSGGAVGGFYYQGGAGQQPVGRAGGEWQKWPNVNIAEVFVWLFVCIMSAYG